MTRTEDRTTRSLYCPSRAYRGSFAVNNIRLICVLQVWDYMYCTRNDAEIGIHELFADQAGSVLTKDNLKQRKRSVNKKKWWRRINKKTMSSYKDWHIPCE